MKIDWSAAPEGATHFDYRNFKEPAFIRPYPEVEGSWMCWAGDRWQLYGFIAEAEVAKMAARQSQWTGSGLPPVGTRCEYQNSLGSWFPVEITAIAKKGICFVQVERDGENYVCQVSSKFRPIRTLEQIETDERDKAIAEMVYGACGCDQSDGTTTAFVICGLLYDAGYRKP